ncbi:NirD/YgiW/YdeI family stress tolerance protein [Edwardsiella piscicida]|uniref:YgiW/YdeI family stress tolerance OB fold protein n=1 Tax=Edwardsiella piscicida TaxID=1263550 RepID=UPI0029108303|nr:NirD/YgiW/YdeI family stress tolerance protein [Edwardsiella piscicida]
MNNAVKAAILALSVAGLAACSTPPQTSLGGGFDGPHQQNVMTVSQVQKSTVIDEGQMVQLRGHIVQALGGEDYRFRDDSGAMTLIVPSSAWAGRVVTPQQWVSVQGRIVKEFDGVKLYTVAIRLD